MPGLWISARDDSTRVCNNFSQEVLRHLEQPREGGVLPAQHNAPTQSWSLPVSVVVVFDDAADAAEDSVVAACGAVVFAGVIAASFLSSPPQPPSPTSAIAAARSAADGRFFTIIIDTWCPSQL